MNSTLKESLSYEAINAYSFCESRKVLRLITIVAIVFIANRAQASYPVPYAVVGCINQGVFQSGELSSTGLNHPALRKITGMTIRVEGFLSPGDRFRASQVSIVSRTCRSDLHKQYFLCGPCRTRPGKVHLMLPEKPGRRIQLSTEAIEEFHNLVRRLKRI